MTSASIVVGEFRTSPPNPLSVHGEGEQRPKILGSKTDLPTASASIEAPVYYVDPVPQT